MTAPPPMNALLQKAAAHFERSELEEAEALCVDVLTRAPTAEAWHLRGLIAINRRDYIQAAEYLTAAVALAPDNFEMHLRLGGALLALEDRARAPEIVEKAVALGPTDREARLYLGQAHLLQKRFDEANAAAVHALAMSPEWPRALELAALIALESGRRDRALQLAQRVLAIESRLPVAHRVAGDVHVFLKNYGLAREHYNAALTLEPKSGKILAHYALLLSRIGEIEEAVDVYQKSLRYLPGGVSAQHGLSMALLAKGRLREGWPLYRRRRSVQKLAARHEIFPRMERPPKAGERVLVWLEEGLGDQIMWASLIPDLQKIGADLIVECDERLIPLFQRSFPDITPIPWTEPAAPIPGARPIGQFSMSDDAASWFRDSIDDFPARRSYLIAPQGLKQTLHTKYRRGRENKLVIGVAWRTAQGGKVADEKTLPLLEWGPLLHMPGVVFVNLQYGDCKEEIAAAQAKLNVRIESDPSIDPVSDVDAFTAQVAAMDLVITTSNATAHVAGALGIPTWVLVPKGFGALWHWFIGHDISPWYPSVRIFRQTEKGNWNTVVDAASSALVDFVDAGRSPAGYS